MLSCPLGCSTSSVSPLGAWSAKGATCRPLLEYIEDVAPVVRRREDRAVDLQMHFTHYAGDAHWDSLSPQARLSLLQGGHHPAPQTRKQSKQHPPPGKHNPLPNGTVFTTVVKRSKLFWEKGCAWVSTGQHGSARGTDEERFGWWSPRSCIRGSMNSHCKCAGSPGPARNRSQLAMMVEGSPHLPPKFQAAGKIRGKALTQARWR